MMMIAVANRIFVAPDYVEPFEERFANRSGLIDDMPGFIQNQVLRPVSEGAPYVVLTLWESQEHFEAWTQSEAFRKAHTGGLPREAYTARNQVEIFEILSDTGRAHASKE
jgi:heme oxygenase (mycobilin-producing)